MFFETDRYTMTVMKICERSTSTESSFELQDDDLKYIYDKKFLTCFILNYIILGI